MEKKEYKIHIVGAGVSGLIAAIALEEQGYHPIVIEATDRAGGRVKTDIFKGYQLDRGFQVLLTAYPMAKKYLDFNNLELNYLKPGAILHNEQGSHTTIGDPLRDRSLLLSTLKSKAASLKDKWQIFTLNRQLVNKSLEEIFSSPEMTTLAYLQQYGFSDKVIHNFFKPFFAGIFLEPSLETSSRMFEFVYKMFGQGMAAIPKNGMEAIAEQLKSKLKHTKFYYDSPVAQVSDKLLLLENGKEMSTHFTIVTGDASLVVPSLKNQEIDWRSCDTLYFEVPTRTIKQPIIGLCTAANALVNNIFYHSSIENREMGANELLSVTVVREHGLSNKALIEQVSHELNAYFGISETQFLKQYAIKKALPKLNNLKYGLSSTETRLTTTIFLAGDVLLNGSLNAAMLAGERAAQGIVNVLEESPDLAHFTSEYI
ncbi:MAG: NAD(P)-binding protein [Croceitalea sp.]|nr:NAD(P)-binding protein [Croceitalea sp.]